MRKHKTMRANTRKDRGRIEKPTRLPKAQGKGSLKLIVLGLTIILCLSVALGSWKGLVVPRAFRAARPAPFAPPPNPTNPSKEYIYAGNRLIATEEPAGANLAAPTSLLANTASGSQVDVSWAASPGANHYQLERAPNITSSYTVLSSNVTTTNFTDTGVTNGTAYLYRARAADAGGNFSSYSNIDLATAITFTDEPLVSGITTIKAVHLTELRAAVNAARATANLSAAAWTDSAPSGVAIKAIHILELRTNLDQALSQLGLAVGPYTDPSLAGVAVKRVHSDEIRQRVK